MTINEVHFSEHAKLRLSQRNLTPDEVDLVLRFGRVTYRTGAKFYFLGKRDLPLGLEDNLSRLVGTTVIVAEDEVVTAYRDQHALSKIKRKSKHYIRRQPFLTQ